MPLSTKVEVQVRRDGVEYEIDFDHGKTKTKLHEIGKAKHTGTTVTFWPDPDIFTETTVYDYDTLAARFRDGLPKSRLEDHPNRRAHHRRRRQSPYRGFPGHGRHRRLREVLERRQGNPEQAHLLRGRERRRHRGSGPAVVQLLFHQLRHGLRQQHQHRAAPHGTASNRLSRVPSTITPAPKAC